MKEIITKEIADELMKIKGEVRGLSLKADREFIFEKYGEDGLKKLENKLKKIGVDVKYNKIRTMDFYPIGLKAIILLAIKEIFSFTDKDIVEMGKFQSKLSLIVKTFTRYFFSLQKMAEKSEIFWNKYYTVGNLKVTELNEKEKYGVMKLKDFKLHPLHCYVLRGFFASVVKMIVRNPVTCEEIKCIFKGDDCHEFLIKW